MNIEEVKFLKWEQIPLGPLQANCYLISNDRNESLIIDPGGEGEKLIQIIEEKNLNPVAILVTHTHYDHIGAVDTIREHYQIPLYVHENEAKWLLDPSLNGSQFFAAFPLVRLRPADKILATEGKMSVRDFTFEMYETPGHSPGSVSFYFKDLGIVICGDALFQGSIGRTDLQGGDYDELITSIRNKLLVLPEDTVVLPGHGNTTTILAEKNTNPFLNGF